MAIELVSQKCGTRKFLCSLVLFLAGCATPPEVKQAFSDQDTAYAENAKLVEHYRDLSIQSFERSELWAVYLGSRTRLDKAAQWIVGEPPAGATGQSQADISAKLLGPEIVQLVNEVRLQNTRAAGTVFVTGTQPTLGKAVQNMPKLARLCREKAQADFNTANAGTPQFDPFATYFENLSRLKKVNSVTQAYCDIDVTVKGEDVKGIAAAIKQLNNGK